MADNKVTLKVGADVSDLEKAFGALIKKIQADADKLKLSPQAAKAAPSTPGSQTFQENLRASQAKTRERAEDQAALNIANSALRQKNAEIEKLTRQQKNIVDNKKAEAFQENEINKALKDRNEIQKTASQLQKRIAADRATEIRSYKQLMTDMAGGFKSGGTGGIADVWRGMNTPEKIGFGATSIGGVLSILSAAADYMGRRPIDITQMQGSAMAMTTGRQLREARTGEYTYEGMYGDDRKKAQEQAATSRKWGTAKDWLALGAGAAMVIGAGASALGTGGLSLGALALGAGGIAGIASGAKVLDPQKYAAYRSQQEAQDFTTMLAGLHEIGPYRKDAIERLKATAGRDIGMQRTLGLGDEGYYGKGGYLKSQMGLGFTDEMVTGASQGILGAGGSTAMAKQSGTALQAERGLGITNAQQLLGQLSGTQSIPETSKKALIDIFSRGFDNSKYAEENRKYMQAVTEQVSKGGTSSLQGADYIATLMRSTIAGTPTTRNIEAGRTAFEAYQTAATATSGYLGGINITSAMQDKDLRKLRDPAELMFLLKMKPNEIDETDPFLESSAKKMGLKGGASELAEKLRNRQPENIRKAIGNRTGGDAVGMVETMFPGLDKMAAEGVVNLLNQKPSDKTNIEIQNLINEGKMGNEKTGKAGDTAIQASSKNAQISLDTLAASISKFADDALVQAKKLSDAAPAGRAAEAEKEKFNMPTNGRFGTHFSTPKVQDQSN